MLSLDINTIVEEAQSVYNKRTQKYKDSLSYNHPDTQPQELYLVRITGRDCPFSWKTEIYSDHTKAVDTVAYLEEQRTLHQYTEEDYQPYIKKVKSMSEAKIVSEMYYYDMRDTKPNSVRVCVNAIDEQGDVYEWDNVFPRTSESFYKALAQTGATIHTQEEDGMEFENTNETQAMLSLLGIVPPTDCWSVYVNVS